MKKILFLVTSLVIFIINAQSFVSNANIEQDFADDSVIVIMDNIVGGINKVHNIGFFTGIDVLDCKDLTYLEGDYTQYGISEDFEIGNHNVVWNGQMTMENL
jgi:hypothetical protein